MKTKNELFREKCRLLQSLNLSVCFVCSCARNGVCTVLCVVCCVLCVLCVVFCVVC